MPTLDAAIATFNRKLIKESWHCVTRSPTQGNVIKIIDDISWPSNLHRSAFKNMIKVETWHEVKSGGTTTNLSNLAAKFVNENQ